MTAAEVKQRTPPGENCARTDFPRSRVDLASAAHWADLVERVARQRDWPAFEQLFDHFAPRLKGYLMRLGSDAALAEEITQDVMATLWHKAGQFDAARSSVATWLFRIARNRRIDWGRRDRLSYMDPLDGAFTQLSSEEAEPDTATEALQHEDRVREAIKLLPEEQRALIMQSFYEGLSHGQIAGKTGLPLGTVKSRLRLAFNRLRKLLEAGPAAERDV